MSEQKLEPVLDRLLSIALYVARRAVEQYEGTSAESSALANLKSTIGEAEGIIALQTSFNTRSGLLATIVNALSRVYLPSVAPISCTQVVSSHSSASRSGAGNSTSDRQTAGGMLIALEGDCESPTRSGTSSSQPLNNFDRQSQKEVSVSQAIRKVLTATMEEAIEEMIDNMTELFDRNLTKAEGGLQSGEDSEESKTQNSDDDADAQPELSRNAEAQPELMRNAEAQPELMRSRPDNDDLELD